MRSKIKDLELYSETEIKRTFRLKGKTDFLLDYIKHLLMLICQKHCTSGGRRLTKKCLNECYENIGVTYNDIIYRGLQLYLAYITGTLHECLKCNDENIEHIDDKIIKAIDLAFYREFVLKEKESEEKEVLAMYPRIQKLSVLDILKLQRMKSRKVGR